MLQALRTLFNIAYRLHPLLGAAWALVLENLNALDRILDSPSTTTQVGGADGSSAALRHSRLQKPSPPPFSAIAQCCGAPRKHTSVAGWMMMLCPQPE